MCVYICMYICVFVSVFGGVCVCVHARVFSKLYLWSYGHQGRPG